MTKPPIRPSTPPSAVPVSAPPPGAPPASRQAGPPGRAAELPRIERGPLAEKPAPRVLLYAVEGWGKTTLAAHAPDPLILMAPGEDGYLTLLGEGRVPEVARAQPMSWTATLSLLDHLTRQSEDFGSLVLDALGGFEKLCHGHVCQREYGGEWGEKGFAAYGRGPEAAVREWLRLLERLDRLRGQGKRIFLLAHSDIRTFSNPLGADYDQYSTDLHKKTWAAIKPWADLILFGDTLTEIQTEKRGRGKAIGGTSRVLHTTMTAGFHAKNRHGLPPEIIMPDDPAALYSTLEAHLDGSAHADNAETREGGVA